MSYYIHERATTSKKHSLTINGNIAIVKRLVDPLFTAEFDIENEFIIGKVNSSQLIDNSYFQKAFAFAKSNVLKTK